MHIDLRGHRECWPQDTGDGKAALGIQHSPQALRNKQGCVNVIPWKVFYTDCG